MEVAKNWYQLLGLCTCFGMITIIIPWDCQQHDVYCEWNACAWLTMHDFTYSAAVHCEKTILAIRWAVMFARGYCMIAR